MLRRGPSPAFKNQLYPFLTVQTPTYLQPQPTAMGASLAFQTADAVGARAFSFQAVGALKSLDVDKLGANTGDLVVATCVYTCNPKGFLEDGCDLRVVWQVRRADNGQVVQETQEPDVNGFYAAPKGRDGQSQFQFRMPAYSVNVFCILKQASIVGGAVTGDLVAGQDQRSVTWAASQQEAGNINTSRQGEENKRTSDVFLQSLWAAFSANLPLLVVGGIVLAGLVIVTPAAIKALEQR